MRGWSTILFPERIQLGENVGIGEGCFIVASGGLTIGDHTQISRNVTIETQSHDYTSNRLPFGTEMLKKPVRIGRCVWIGMNANILPGVTIGDGAIIGLGTTISKNVPERAIVVGAASRVVGYRDEEHFRRLLESELFVDYSDKSRATRQ